MSEQQTKNRVLITAKSGNQYWSYPEKAYRKLCRPRKGITTFSKSGRRYLGYYQKLETRNGVKYGAFRYSKANIDRAKKRDNYSCQMCGATATKLHVHHKDKQGIHLTPNPNNGLDNLITLCAKCHIRLHLGRLDRYGNIQELRNEGLTLAEIGKTYGVSKQRIHQLLKNS